MRGVQIFAFTAKILNSLFIVILKVLKIAYLFLGKK